MPKYIPLPLYRAIGFFTVVIAGIFLSNTAFASTLTAANYRDEINRLRQQERQPALTSSYTLNRAALRRAQDMSAYHYFSHVSPLGKTFSSFINLGPAKFSATGEIMSRNYLTARSSVNAWLTSTSHAAQIRSKKYTHLGAAVGKVTIKGKTTNVAVVMFGQVR